MVQALQTPTVSRFQALNDGSVQSSSTPGTTALLSGKVSDYSQASLADAIARSRKYARLVTLACGETSPEAAVAWEELDELLSVRSRYGYQRPQSSFDQYCTLNPDAPECRVYDA